MHLHYRQIKIFLIAILVTFPVSHTNAQDATDIEFRHYGLKQGMQDATVYDMIQGRHGFFWIATQNGILRFDGIDFTQFLPPETDGNVQQNLPDKLLEDSYGGIWAGYQQHSLVAQYDPTAGDFIYRDMNEEVEVPGGVQHTRLMGIDKQNKLWVVLIRYENPEEPWLITIDTESGEINNVYVDEDGNSLFTDGEFFRVSFGYMGVDKFLATDEGVWLGALNAVFFKDYDGSIKKYDKIEGSDEELGASSINKINKDEVWVTTMEGIHIYDENTDQFKPAGILPDAVQDTIIWKSYQDAQGDIWITANHNTYRIRGDKVEDLSGRDDLFELSAAVLYPKAENERHIWFINKDVTPGPERADGLTRYDKITDQFLVIKADPAREESIKSNNFISNVLQDQNGTIWVGNFLEGLSSYNPKGQKFTNAYEDTAIQQELGSHHAITAKEAPDEKIWTATTKGSIYVTDPETNETRKFYEFENKNQRTDINQNYVFDIYIPENGIAWFATEWSGLQRIYYNPESLEIDSTHIWIPRSGTDNYQVNIPLSITEGDDDNIWIGTVGGLAEYNSIEGSFENYDVNEGGHNPNYSYGRYSLKDSEGRVWYYGENGSGLKSVNPITKEITRYNTRGEVPEAHVFTNGQLEDVIEDSEGNILAAFDGLFILDQDKNQFKPVLDNFTIFVTVIRQDDEGLYVVGTYGRGIYWIDREQGIVKHISQKDGLANDIITGLHFDTQGDLWTIHALGLSRYNPESGQIINYNENHGLDGVSGNPFELQTTQSGYFVPLWVSQNLTIFKPSEINITENVVPAQITSVRSTHATLPVISNGDLNLPHDFGEIIFQLSSPQYTDAAFQQFRYRLSASNQQWSTWSNNRNVQFANLAPGSYNLEVQTRNADRIESPDTLNYNFSVIPPWYQTGLARLLFVLFGGGIVIFGAFRYSTYRTRQQAVHLRAEQAEEIARLDQMKTNLFINISHELRTPLTLIIGPLNQLAELAKKLGDGWDRRIDIARRNGQRLQQLVEQVLDLTRLDANKMALEISEVELTSFLKRTLESFESMAEQKKITLISNLPEKEIYQTLDKDKFEKILVNLCSNALKFTPEKGTVTLKLIHDADSLHVSVKDTGRGIDQNQIPQVFDRFHSTREAIMNGGQGLGIGLAIAKQFVELHEGTISVESVQGKGTTFSVTLPRHSEKVLTAPKAANAEEYIEEPPGFEKIPPFSVSFSSATELSPLILVVEDNDDMREYLSDLLVRAQLRVETAKNGIEGRKKLSLIKPDMIISDIMMPQMDGFKFASLVRSMPDHLLTPILMLSAKAEVEDRIQGFEIGVSDYLVKPFNERELLVRVQNLLKYKIAREEEHQNGEPSDEVISYDDDMVNRLRTYVEERIDNTNLSTEELSQTINVSRRQLYRNLKAATGFTPAEFVREIKLFEARRLLEKRQVKTVSEAMYATGYTSKTHFSKLFKNRYGILPSEYLHHKSNIREF